MRLLAGRYPQRIESSCTPGLPDIAYVGGWIECKYAPKMPKSGKLKIRHWRPEQAAWHKAYWRVGGKSWVIVQVGNQYGLYYGNLFTGDVRDYELRDDLGNEIRRALVHGQPI